MRRIFLRRSRVLTGLCAISSNTCTMYSMGGRDLHQNLRLGCDINTKSSMYSPPIVKFTTCSRLGSVAKHNEDEELAKKKGCQIVKVLDEKNEGMDLVQYEDLLFGTFIIKYFDPATQMRSMKQLPHRHDDTIVCAYPKSGSHWMVNLLTMLLSTSPIHIAKSVDIPIIEAIPHEIIEKKPSPRVLHSHLRFERLPSDHVAQDGRLILTVRNPKDVAVSLFYHLQRDAFFNSKLSWNGFLKHFIAGNVLMGSYFEYLRSWDHVLRTKNLNILVVHYESLMKNPIEEARRIQTFLGLKLSDSRLNEVIDRCSLDKLNDDVVSRRTRTSLLDKNRKPMIYRKGVIGDWMNHFTVAQNEEFDKLIEEKLSDTMFKFDYYPATLKQKL